MPYPKRMLSLAFELTRRCNLNCPFCSKGDPQNMDITKEIIDKTLDEVQNLYIEDIRLSGGEPFLNPDMIVYLLSEIERRQIVVRSLFAFTNGTIQDPRIRDAFERCAKYIAKVDNFPAVQGILSGRDIPERHVYKGVAGKMVGIIVSADNNRFHKNSHVIDDTINYYRQIENSNFYINRQDKELDENRLSSIILEGKAEANYKDLLLKKEYIQRVRRINNKFNIMQPEGDSVWWINKSISISSNGNVYPGCMMPYTKIDTDPMFNIMDCRNNFFEKVEEWCWRYPIWPKQHRQRETYEAYLWCKERGIEFLQDIRPEDEATEALFAELTNEFEKTAIRNHRLFPYLTYSEIGALSFCSLATCLHLMKMPVEVFKNYLIAYADLDTEVIEILTSSNIFELVKLSMTYSQMNTARAKAARFKK